MHDEDQTTTPAGEAGTTETVEGAILVAETTNEAGQITAEALVATDFTHTVIVAAFADQESAMETYQALKDAEIAHGLHIDAVAVVRSDEEGRIHAQEVTDHSTKTGVKWGVASGVVLGIIFPPSILVSAVAVGVAGGAVGKMRNVHHRIELEEELRGALPPDSSGIIALVESTETAAVKETMPKATKVTEQPVDDATAKDIEEAAKQSA